MTGTHLPDNGELVGSTRTPDENLDMIEAGDEVKLWYYPHSGGGQVTEEVDVVEQTEKRVTFQRRIADEKLVWLLPVDSLRRRDGSEYDGEIVGTSVRMSEPVRVDK